MSSESCENPVNDRRTIRINFVIVIRAQRLYRIYNVSMLRASLCTFTLSNKMLRQKIIIFFILSSP